MDELIKGLEQRIKKLEKRLSELEKRLSLGHTHPPYDLPAVIGKPVDGVFIPSVEVK